MRCRRRKRNRQQCHWHDHQQQQQQFEHCEESSAVVFWWSTHDCFAVSCDGAYESSADLDAACGQRIDSDDSVRSKQCGIARQTIRFTFARCRIQDSIVIYVIIVSLVGGLKSCRGRKEANSSL